MKPENNLAFELQNIICQLGKANSFKHNHSHLKGAEKHMLLLIAGFENSEAVTTSEIAAKTGVTLAAVTHQMNSLEKEGLIERLQDKEDRRIIFIRLSKKGRAQVKKLKKEFAKKIKVLADFLGENDTKDLIRLVKKMSSFQGFTQ